MPDGWMHQRLRKGTMIEVPIMIRSIAGEIFNTSTGRMIVAPELDEPVSKGDRILFKGKEYIVSEVIASTVPTGRWAFKVIEDQ